METKKLKIAIYSGAIPSTTFIENLIQEVAKKHEVILIGNIKKKRKYHSKNIKIVATPYSKWLYIPLTFWRMFLLLFKNPSYIIVAWKRARQNKKNYLKIIRFTRYIAVLLHKPDVFHIQWARRLERWTFLKEVYDCKIMLSLLGTQINIAPKYEKDLVESFNKHFKFVDCFISVSQDTANQLTQFNVPNHKNKVIHMSVPKLAFDNFKMNTKCANGLIKLVSVGRHDWVKGYSYAIEAVKTLLKNGLNVEYTIIAQGKVPEEILFQVHQLGIQKQVQFVKGKKQKELFNSLHEYDIMILSSLSEGISNAVVEAMAIGIPVISTNCGGMREIIKPNETGWLVPIRDSKSIANAVEEICNLDEANLTTIIKNAHELVHEQFHPDNVTPKIISLYTSFE